MANVSIEARNIVKGDYVVGFGYVTRTQIHHQQVANRGDTRRNETTVHENQRLSVLQRARLAQESVEKVFREEPRSIQVYVGQTFRYFNLDDRVTVRRSVAVEQGERVAA